MVASLCDICAELTHDNTVRVIIVIGKGNCFSCGWETPRQGNSLPRPAAALAALKKPVIAALNGDAIDQGLEIAMAADIRIAADNAKLGISMVREGTFPWDGGTQRLSRIVGRAKSIEMLLTGSLIKADEAMRTGLVNQVVPQEKVIKVAENLAKQIGGTGPIAAQYAKEAVSRGQDLKLDDGLRLEGDLNFLLHGTRDRAEGLKAFLERRTPEFHGE